VSEQHAGQLAGTHWNPQQYLKFSDHRLRPALELMARIPLASAQRIFDLGCGTGHITRLLAERWPMATVYGLDNSAEMLRKAQKEIAAAAESESITSRVEWQQADIADWQPQQSADIIYSNATLQWLPEHATLFPRLLGLLRPGGCLAVQMPLSWDMPSHRLMRETLANGGPGGRALGTQALHRAVARKWVDDAGVFYDLLAGRVARLDIWQTEYLQVLEGDDAVLEWVRSTGLRPILNGLDDTERELFLAEYRSRLRAAYPLRADGHTLYPFRRLFIVATL
jgi:trans-aconitate 2-methyltransferase